MRAHAHGGAMEVSPGRAHGRGGALGQACEREGCGCLEGAGAPESAPAKGISVQSAWSLTTI